jgi:hypothetical protein
MDYQQAITILFSALGAAAAALILGILNGLWAAIRNHLSKRTVQVLDEIVAPVVVTTIKDPEVSARFTGMFTPDSPGGRWPTEGELRELAKVVEQKSRPQLKRLRGFALQYAEQEVLAAVRRFFARLTPRSTGSVPAGTTSPLEGGPIGPDHEATE